MMRAGSESTIGIEDLDEPALVVASNGAVEAMNRAARAVLPGADRLHSLFAAGPDDPEALRRYLLCCAGAHQPMLTSLSMAGAAGRVRMRCFGSLLAPSQESRPASILLRLYPGNDTRFSASAERIRRQILDRRCRIAIERSDELRADRLRIVEQYVFVAEALRQVERQKRELESAITHVRTEERETIAQDLHDQAGQELARVVAQIRLMRDSTAPDAGEWLDALAEQLLDVGRRLFRAAIGCRPRIVEELGLAAAIDATVKAFASDTGYAGTFSVEGVPVPLPAVVESAIYRIAQEALTNSVKHATGARNLMARLTFTNDGLVLIVADDGAGFGSGGTAQHDGRGQGVRGMRQRMTSIGGSLEIQSAEHGTIVTAMARIVPEPMRILKR
jgi:two-component system sensor histidine kinase DegS